MDRDFVFLKCNNIQEKKTECEKKKLLFLNEQANWYETCKTKIEGMNDR